jgi:hypothetical protein
LHGFLGALLHQLPGDAPKINAILNLTHKEKSQTSLEGAGFLNGADYRHHTMPCKYYDY